MSSKAKIPKPRGLWTAARRTPKPGLEAAASKRARQDDHYHSARHRDGDEYSSSDDCCDSDSSTNSLSKRFKSLDSPPTSEEDEVIFWDYSRNCSSQPERIAKWTTRSKIMDTSPISGSGENRSDRGLFNLEDWKDLKELFSKAVEVYESEEPPETIPFLRGVIHECHRFMKDYQDPSSLFGPPPQPEQSTAITPVEQKFVPEWLSERSPSYPPPSGRYPDLSGSQNPQKVKPTPVEPEKKCKCQDLPTTFHTIFGTTLFLFGNLIAQDQSLALQGEPTTPTPYWLSAIDVFNIGDNLPIRTSGRGCPNAPEDWRMAVVWGRALVNLADEILTRQKAPSTPKPMFHPLGFDPRPTFSSVFLPPINSPDEPKWSPDSPFALIADLRPPSFRIDMNTSTPNELLNFAQDQFSRGIFHMPHQSGKKFQRPSVAQSSHSSSSSLNENQPTDTLKVPLSLSLAASTFSRAKELYTIGSEVLLVAEKLEEPSERYSLAMWADGIFGQMNNVLSSTEEPWKTSLAIARGRSNLVMGSALAEEMDSQLEMGEMQVLDTSDAEDGRDALKKSIDFLEKAKELLPSDVLIPGASPKSPSFSAESTIINDDEEILDADIFDDDSTSVTMMDEHEEQNEISKLLAEAFVTLGNLTSDETAREALYARAREEGSLVELDDDRMDESD